MSQPASLLDIRLFVAAFEERSFTLAAQRENATQSGVSQHVRALEERLGAALFMRLKGGIEATPAGRAYYEKCLDILRAEAAARDVVRPFASSIEASLVVGLMPTLTRCALAPALARFLDTHPNATIRIVEGYSGALTRMAQADEIDFAIVPAFAGLDGLRQSAFLQTRELLVSRADGATQGHTPVRLAQVDALRLVLPGAVNTRRQTIETYCARAGARIEAILELDAMFGTLDFVARTGWRTILPAVLVGDQVGPALQARPLGDPGLTLDLVRIEPARRPLAPAAQAFNALLQEEAARLSALWD
ncbi:MAG: transcriptional regulator, LysR family [Hyphomicrobiales bacterium]|nr:transcriptional regulator, LysR family [Hyphomicrobiales bacterium]